MPRIVKTSENIMKNIFNNISIVIIITAIIIIGGGTAGCC